MAPHLKHANLEPDPPKKFKCIVINKIILEILTSIKRSGANLIITWHAKEIAEFIQTNN